MNKMVILLLMVFFWGLVLGVFDSCIGMNLDTHYDTWQILLHDWLNVMYGAMLMSVIMWRR